MPPKLPKLINCSGCLTKHARPSCLWKKKISEMASKTTPFSADEYQQIFGEDGEAGQVPDRDSPEYLPYIETLSLTRQKELDNSLREQRVREVENKLRRLSVSSNPSAGGGQGPKTQGQSMVTGTSQSTRGTNYQAAASKQQCGNLRLASIPDLSKLCPEAFCSAPKTYDKITFRELIRGCTKVMMYLRYFNVDIDGYLLHLSFIMDKAAIPGVYTTEGLVLYEREVTSKVIRGELSDWPEVDLASDSRFLSYEYTFDHVSCLDQKTSSSGKSRKRNGKKNKSLIYDFDRWDPEICWLWNCRQCEGCDRKHGVCGLCSAPHKALDCDKHRSTNQREESRAAEL